MDHKLEGTCPAEDLSYLRLQRNRNASSPSPANIGSANSGSGTVLTCTPISSDCEGMVKNRLVSELIRSACEKATPASQLSNVPPCGTLTSPSPVTAKPGSAVPPNWLTDPLMVTQTSQSTLAKSSESGVKSQAIWMESAGKRAGPPQPPLMEANRS